ncbi:hypothetical protein DI09_63p10, partial [Mitosporidium daphniae]
MALLDVDSILEQVILIVKDVSTQNFCHKKRDSTTQDTFKVSKKNNSPTDLVTERDIAIEREIASKLSLAFPHIFFLGEEGIQVPTNNVSCNQNGPCYYWVLDPIDGTINFLHGLLSHSCVSLALVEVPKMAGECPDPLIGIIYHPTLKKLYYSVKGKGAYLVDENESSTPQRLPLYSHMSNSEKRMSDCLVVTEWNLPMMGYVPEYKACITSIMHSLIQIPVHGIRSFGSAAMNLTKIAEGAGDIYYEIGIHSWDIAAGILIVKEAGGVVENITSTSVDMRKGTI